MSFATNDTKESNSVFIEYLEDVIKDCNDHTGLQTCVCHIVAFVRPHDGWSVLCQLAVPLDLKEALTPSRCPDSLYSCGSLRTIVARDADAIPAHEAWRNSDRAAH